MYQPRLAENKVAVRSRRYVKVEIQLFAVANLIKVKQIDVTEARQITRTDYATMDPYPFSYLNAKYVANARKDEHGNWILPHVYNLTWSVLMDDIDELDSFPYDKVLTNLTSTYNHMLLKFVTNAKKCTFLKDRLNGPFMRYVASEDMDQLLSDDYEKVATEMNRKIIAKAQEVLFTLLDI